MHFFASPPSSDASTDASGEKPDPRSFYLAIRALADALVFGQEASRFRGAGLEYEQSRPYQQGDPVRHIDWRVSARAGKPFLKEYEAPRQIPVVLLLDGSASMRLSSIPGTSKLETALTIAGALALASLDRVNPVGFLGLETRGKHWAPTTSAPSVLRVLEEFRQARGDEGTAVGERLRSMLPSLPSKSLLVCLSDLHDPTAPDALRAAAQIHDCIVIRPRDPLENPSALGGIFRAAEAETRRSFTLGLRRASASPPSQSTVEILQKAAIDCLELPLEKPFAADLRRFLSHRARRRTGAF